MNRLIDIAVESDIPAAYRAGPLGALLRYHNLGADMPKRAEKPELLIGMCMDSRKHLRIPDNFAFILRTGGANLRLAEFRVSYAIAVGGVRAIALIAHTNCGMSGLVARREVMARAEIQQNIGSLRDNPFPCLEERRRVGRGGDGFVREQPRHRGHAQSVSFGSARDIHIVGVRLLQREAHELAAPRYRRPVEKLVSHDSPP